MELQSNAPRFTPIKTPSADARNRLRDWVALSGTRLDRDRPTHQTAWPGEPPADPVEEVEITDRDDGFINGQYVAHASGLIPFHSDEKP
ncbi:hypothetical protein [Agromyces laixinhei]|uniref:hypothetical protein n=1 Tax=Agromyces laixinhei TaxID=2585717 RepID=UPI001E5B07BC|nr:hypothetical protein [Agromyces laixinhei]